MATKILSTVTFPEYPDCDWPLIDSALLLGHWILKQPGITSRQVDIIQRLQAVLVALPTVPLELLTYSVHLDFGGSPPSLCQVWRVELSTEQNPKGWLRATCLSLTSETKSYSEECPSGSQKSKFRYGLMTGVQGHKRNAEDPAASESWWIDPIRRLDQLLAQSSACEWLIADSQGDHL
jgi:hypothetical protein